MLKHPSTVKSGPSYMEKTRKYTLNHGLVFSVKYFSIQCEVTSLNTARRVMFTFI
jgi:hypothetical protein